MIPKLLQPLWVADTPGKLSKPIRDGIIASIFAMVALLASGMAFSQSYVFQKQFGSLGNANGQFNAPTSVAIDPLTHDIVVADFGNNRVQVFDPNGVYLNQFGFGNQLVDLLGIAINAGQHRILVGGHAGVQIFDFSGNYLGQLTGLAETPTSIAVDPVSQGTVVAGIQFFIDTTLSDGFQTFSSAGVPQTQFTVFTTGQGQFAGPLSVAIDPRNENIVLSDVAHNRLQIFNPAGALVTQFGTAGTSSGQFNNIGGSAIDGVSGNIVVTDSGNNRVQVLSQSTLGQFGAPPVYLSQFGANGSGNGQFNRPTSVAIDPVSHNLVVVDSGNDRVQIFAPVTAGAVSVTEYYNAHDDLYFITANPFEAAVVDSGADNVGSSIWTRTGFTLKAYASPGPGNDVCRFYNPRIQPVGSHFYAALPAECNLVRTTLPAWNYELANAFNIVLPVNGSCPIGFVPVYRYYDNRASQSWRFITDTSVNAVMLAKGGYMRGYRCARSHRHICFSGITAS